MDGRAPLDRLGVLRGSLLAEQVFCELRLHHAIVEGKAFRVSPGIARKIVREIIGTRRKSFLVGAVFSGELCGAPVAVSPDLVVLDGHGKVRYIVRARIRGGLRISLSDEIHSMTAMLLAEESGMLGSDPLMAFMVAVSGDALREAMEAVMTSNGIIKPMRGNGWLISTRVYERERAVEIVCRLIEYWLGLRPPRPSPSPYKCRLCEYSGQCSYSATRKAKS